MVTKKVYGRLTLMDIGTPKFKVVSLTKYMTYILPTDPVVSWSAIPKSTILIVK